MSRDKNMRVWEITCTYCGGEWEVESPVPPTDCDMCDRRGSLMAWEIDDQGAIIRPARRMKA